MSILGEYKYRPIRNLFLTRLNNNEEFISIGLVKYGALSFPGISTDASEHIINKISHNKFSLLQLIGFIQLGLFDDYRGELFYDGSVGIYWNSAEKFSVSDIGRISFSILHRYGKLFYAIRDN